MTCSFRSEKLVKNTLGNSERGKIYEVISREEKKCLSYVKHHTLKKFIHRKFVEKQKYFFGELHENIAISKKQRVVTKTWI